MKRTLLWSAGSVLMLSLLSGQGCLSPETGGGGGGGSVTPGSGGNGDVGPQPDGNGSGSGGDLPGPVTATVTIRNLAYSPQTVTISRGEAVQWTNEDFLVHTVTSGDPGDTDAGELFDSGDLSPGGIFVHTFNEAGTFEYFCIPHALTMRDAVVNVLP